jgi:hypothetical protein
VVLGYSKAFAQRPGLIESGLGGSEGNTIPGEDPDASEGEEEIHEDTEMVPEALTPATATAAKTPASKTKSSA